MRTNCERLSDNARKIFDKIKPFYPPNPWKKPQWNEDGLVFDNGWLDLRKSSDRDCLQNQKESSIGFSVKIAALVYRDKHKSLEGFSQEHYSKSIENSVALLLLLEDLDFQIETMDLVEG